MKPSKDPLSSSSEKSSINRLARLLDAQFQGPFGIRIGLDGLIGLIPVVGDLITSALSLGIVGYAYRQGYPMSLILRMLVNILIESFIDAIPIIGNIFDFFWKSNLKNLELMNSYEAHPGKAKKKSVVFLILILIIFALIVCCVIALATWLLIEAYQVISGTPS